MQGTANIYPICINPKKGKDGKTAIIEKCPACYRKTLVDGKCTRCRHIEKGGAKFICL